MTTTAIHMDPHLSAALHGDSEVVEQFRKIERPGSAGNAAISARDAPGSASTEIIADQQLEGSDPFLLMEVPPARAITPISDKGSIGSNFIGNPLCGRRCSVGLPLRLSAEFRHTEPRSTESW